MLSILRPIWEYRGFIIGSVKREFQLKYRNSLLGAAWVVLQPLAMIVVYTVIFSQVMKAKLPDADNAFGYSIYLCAGVLSWGLFSEITTRSQNMFLDNANLIKKINFPRSCLPVAVVTSALLNFVIVFGLFTVFLLIAGSFPGVVYLALIPVLMVLILFSVGLGLVLGVLNVFFRDVGQFFSMFITFWFWLTPIVYPPTILPERIQSFIALNPLTSVMAAIQGILVRGDVPRWEELAYPLLLGLLLCVLGVRLFRKHAGEMVDEL